MYTYISSKVACIVIGYLFGMVLMAEIVARVGTGKSAFSIGSGNPGMANIMSNVGFAAGFLTLAGDITKCVVAFTLCYSLFPELEANRLYIAYCALGLTLGHDFPLWHLFKGGKGVTTECCGIIVYEPVWGIVSCVIGMRAVFLTGYLPLGAVIIPVIFLPYAACCETVEVFAVYGCITVLAFFKHRHGLMRVIKGEEKEHAKLL